MLQVRKYSVERSKIGLSDTPIQPVRVLRSKSNRFILVNWIEGKSSVLWTRLKRCVAFSDDVILESNWLHWTSWSKLILVVLDIVLRCNLEVPPPSRSYRSLKMSELPNEVTKQTPYCGSLWPGKIGFFPTLQWREFGVYLNDYFHHILYVTISVAYP